MKKVVLISLLVIPLLLICCCCTGYFVLLAYNSPDYQDNDLPFEEIVDEYDDDFEDQFIDDDQNGDNDSRNLPDTPNDGVDEFASINGFLSYPSEFLPEMEVCAEEVTTGDTSCTDELIENPFSPSGYSYTLVLLPGDYEVYAMEVDQNGQAVDGYKAYYSEFVTCGLEVSCPSHDPIEVSVEVGDELYNIDPGDWYDPTQ